MIINIRGTSGSGKTHLVREVVSRYDEKKPIFLKRRIEWDTKKKGRLSMDKRKQPLCYVYRREGSRPLVLLGHYETACGGCDTIPQLDLVFHLVRQYHEAGYDVIFEGLLVSGERIRTRDFAGEDFVIIQLTTDLDQCINDINARRREANPDADDVNPDNTIKKHGAIENAVNDMEEEGFEVYRFGREDALTATLQLLGLE